MGGAANVIRKLGAILLILWGLLNAVGGFVGGREHPAGWIGPAFLVVGLLIAWSGVAFLRGRSRAFALAVVGLLGLSAVALASGILLNGAESIRITHHLLRLAISAALLALAAGGRRRVVSPPPSGSGRPDNP